MSSEESLLFMYDYYYLWSAGKVALEGGNVYDRAKLASVLYSIGWPAHEGVQRLTHLPWNIPLYMLIAILSFESSRVSWLFLSFFTLLAAVSLTSRTINKFSINKVQLIFALIAFPPVLKTFYWGQISTVLLLALSGFIYFYLKGKRFKAGVFLALTLLKPHHLLPLYAFLFIQDIKARDYKCSMGLALGFILLNIPVFCIYPQAYKYYFEAGASITSEALNIVGASLSQLTLVLENKWTQFVLIFLSTSGLALYGLSKKADLKHDIFWILPLCLTASPYLWSHDLLLLLFPYLILVQKIFEKYPRSGPYIILPLGLLGAVLCADPRFEIYASIMPLALLAFGIQSRCKFDSDVKLPF